LEDGDKDLGLSPRIRGLGLTHKRKVNIVSFVIPMRKQWCSDSSFHFSSHLLRNPVGLLFVRVKVESEENSWSRDPRVPMEATCRTYLLRI